jgi:uncharacterized membrane protein YdjX (TVP38/TMEM64 family)
MSSKLLQTDSSNDERQGSWLLLQEKEDNECPSNTDNNETHRLETISSPATNEDDTFPSLSSPTSGNTTIRFCSRGKVLVAIIWIVLILLLIVDSTTSTKYSLSVLQTILRWIEDNPIPGFVACIAVYTIATVLCLPGSILTLGIGFIFSNSLGLVGGVLIGTLAVFLGASAGAILAWSLSRYVFRHIVTQYVMDRYTTFQALDNALQQQGLKIMFLLRLSPIIPFNALNYLAGITAISLKDYSLALLGMLPGTIVYVFLGASAGSLAEIQARDQTTSGLTIGIIVVGIISGLTAIGLTSYYAKREFQLALEARQQEI